MSTPLTSHQRAQAMAAEQAAEWYVANREADATPEQAEAFMRWLQASPLHVAEYLGMVALAQHAPAAARQDPVPIEQLLLQAKADASVRVLPAPSSPGDPSRRASSSAGRRSLQGSSSRRHVPWAIAAVMAFVAIVATVWMFDPSGRAEVRDVVTAHGEQAEYPLPDGSVLRLNSDSAATIRFDRRTRRVDVTRGQALFEIADQADWPFEVGVGGHVIEDIGTTFDVHRRSGDTLVTVAEGRVQVRKASPQPRDGWPWRRPVPGALLADLQAGQQVRVGDDGAVQTRSRLDTQALLAWTRAQIVFDDEPLHQVVAEFNRYNRTQVRIEDASLGELRVTGVFGIHDVGTFGAFLATLPAVDVQQASDAIVVRRH